MFGTLEKKSVNFIFVCTPPPVTSYNMLTCFEWDFVVALRLSS